MYHKKPKTFESACPENPKELERCDDSNFLNWKLELNKGLASFWEDMNDQCE